MAVRTTILVNGARVVTETLSHARSVSIGFWVAVGSRDEPPELAGASHFLEHLLFKGTDTHSASEIAEAVEAVGGEMNAFTAHEHTAYHARLPAAELTLGLELLSEVFTRPAFRGHEVEAERQVILEELAMEEDSHEDRVLSLLADAMFPDHPLGAEVLGTRATILAMTREQIAGFHHHWYRPSNLVVAVAGGLDHEQVVRAVERRFASIEEGPVPVRRPPLAPAQALRVGTQRSEQAHVAVGLPGFSRHDDDRHALVLANQVLGGGTSSRLFRTVREDRGLAYSVWSDVSFYADAGALVAAAATAPPRLPEVLGLVHGEVDRLLAAGVSERELEVAKGYVIGSTLLALEDSGSCMGRIATDVVSHGSVADLDDVLDRYRRITRVDIERALARIAASGRRSVAVVGPLRRSRVEAMLTRLASGPSSGAQSGHSGGQNQAAVPL
ncbi:MAG TPA: pitrilysin family protein [Acidimicrobiales bacterium]|nr:pitrilysin family protein [Acidimicrobiales bacterium]